MDDGTQQLYISASYISSGTIKSENYDEDVEGMYINLNDGSLWSPYFWFN
jgi:hypothetical protein